MKYKLIIQALKESPDPNVRAFVREVENIRRLSKAERYYRLKNRHEPGAVSILVKDCIPYIIKVAYAQWLETGKESVLDLINEGMVGACDAFQKHDHKDKRMIILLRSYIKKYISNAANSHNQPEPEETCPADEMEWQNEDDILNSLDRGRERILLTNLIEEKMGSNYAAIIKDYYFNPESDIPEMSKKYHVSTERVRQVIHNFTKLYNEVGDLWGLFSSDFNLPVHEKKVKRFSHLIRTTFMRNRNGIEIKECCASCFFKQISSNKGRWCLKHSKCVKNRMSCRDWVLSDDLQHAGDSGGMVKRKEYFDFLVNLRNREIEEGLPPHGLEEARALFEKLYGSIYY